ncbi:RNA polymerase sigma factor SigM [Shimia thalassica]|uniref:RNA polymerase sigma factor SigZ n=1 Tax=Shimia thalassica TaxID=1715693 RepID=A0A0P1I233_9RHOB|nr:RNA polymerase sigma factor SigZ [Shimia thalassica]CUJ85175.1 RNA polymerase sigma factor SigM [Shimia thalassica]
MISTDQIWAEYRTALKGFLHNRVANAADVDDLLQDILLKTHMNLNELQSAKSIRGWLFAVARNATIDHYRKQGRALPDADDLWYADEDLDPQDEFEPCLRPFITGLPDAQAALLTAVDLEGVSQRDYAEAEGISYSTLKSRVKTARNALRGQFDRCCALTLDHNGAVIDYSRRKKSCGPC